MAPHRKKVHLGACYHTSPPPQNRKKTKLPQQRHSVQSEYLFEEAWLYQVRK
jgi:hypothetical protein